VNSVDCGKTHIGDSVLGDTAQGQFCTVSLSVKNIGNQAQTFDDSAQLAYDSAGRQYSVNSEADLDVNPNMWLEDINPGNKVSGSIIFDIPKGDKITRLELHDSEFSGGVTVDNRR
jgi:hypothetical protein